VQINPDMEGRCENKQSRVLKFGGLAGQGTKNVSP